MNYTTTEQEMLAFVYCFTQWRCYLEGSQVLLHTDHEPLTWLATQERPNRRQARWLEFLAGFSYEILYVKGDENVMADALSRMLSPPEAEQLQLPGDTFPLKQQNTVYSYQLGKPTPGPSGRQAASTARIQQSSATGLGAVFAHSNRNSTGNNGTERGKCGTVPRRYTPPQGEGVGKPATGRPAKTGDGCIGLASPLHRNVLLGGHTRRLANAVKPTGCRTADASTDRGTDNHDDHAERVL